ncbi:MAG: NfeD family protein, partial [Chloroflexota bacterium]
PIAIGAGVVLGFAYNRLLLIPLMEKMRGAPIVGDEQDELLSSIGRMTSDLTPPEAGTAYVNGETWTVRSSEPLSKGDGVSVVAVEGLALVVERHKLKQMPRPPTDEADDRTERLSDDAGPGDPSQSQKQKRTGETQL